MNASKTAALIGCPDDRGVYNNGGRPGAKDGPAAFRSWLNKPKGAYDVQSNFLDYGNVSPITATIYETHEKVAQQITQAHKDGCNTLVIGGGHDYAHAHLKGLHNTLIGGQQLGCINIDPHFDLRPYQFDILSGSPFHMALEEAIIEGQNLVEFGIQHFCNGAPLWDYAKNHHVSICTREEMRFSGVFEQFRSALGNLSQQCQQIAISLDLDVINLAFAPGVSAPNVEGFNPSEVLALLGEAASYENVNSLGIYELNPRFDKDAHTARLAATAAFTFFDHKFNG